MARIYLVRHSQTLFNVLRRTQGQCDSPLTKEGIEIATNLGKYFEKVGISFDHAYCSTSERTEDTLNHITNSHVPYTRSKKLKEVAFGSLEGGDDENIFKRFPNLNLDTYDLYLGPYGLENTVLAAKRFDDILKEIAMSSYKNVLVVSHGLIIVDWIAKQSKEMLDEYMKLKDTPYVWMDNCDCIVLEYNDNKFEIVDFIKYKLINK